MTDSLVSFVLTPHFGLPSPDDIVHRWRWTGHSPPMTVRRDGRGLVCEAGTMRSVLVPMRGRIPDDAAEARFEFSVARYFEYERPEPHTDHVAIASSFSGAKISVREAELHAGLVAVLADLLDATAVCGEQATHPAAYVVATVEERLVRTGLWCGVSYAKAKGRDGVVSLLTRGMETFGLMELELHCAQADAKDSLNQLLDVATYVAKLGRDLSPGETFDAEGTSEHFPVSHHESPVQAAAMVCRLDATSVRT